MHQRPNHLNCDSSESDRSGTSLHAGRLPRQLRTASVHSALGHLLERLPVLGRRTQRSLEEGARQDAPSAHPSLRIAACSRTRSATRCIARLVSDAGVATGGRGTSGLGRLSKARGPASPQFAGRVPFTDLSSCRFPIRRCFGESSVPSNRRRLPFPVGGTRLAEENVLARFALQTNRNHS